MRKQILIWSAAIFLTIATMGTLVYSMDLLGGIDIPAVTVPRTHAYTASGNLPTILVPVLLLDGDNDSTNESVDLQNGTIPGQQVVLIATADIDSDDTCTVAVTDTTCTNCAAIVFDKVGENATLLWTGTTWVLISLVDNL